MSLPLFLDNVVGMEKRWALCDNSQQHPRQEKQLDKMVKELGINLVVEEV